MMAQESNSNCNSCPIPRKKQAKKHDLVGILVNDELLLREWLRFCEKLECPAQDKLRWEQGIHNLTFQYFDVFSEMLDDWIERNSNKMTVGDLCRILKDIGCVAVAEELKSEFETNEIIQQGEQKSSAKKNVFLQKKEINWPLKHGLSVPTGNFTGREEQLEEIKTNFESKNNLMLITGFGGIGKTELCRKVAYEIETSCVWLHGENNETLRESVLKLAGELGITNEGNPTVLEFFEYIVSFILEKSSRLLLVIDNVDVSYPEVLKIIQIIRLAKHEKMFVIVTSRDKNVLKGAGITMQLDILSKLQARIMLQSSMSGLEDSDADKLAELVEYFPLALQRAVGYIKQQRSDFGTPNYSVTDYVREFEVKRLQMLGHKLNKFEDNYSMTTLVTWDMTISKMSDGAVEILKILAYLDPDGVELCFLKNICTQMGVVDFDEGLNMLNGYCLVKIGDAEYYKGYIVSDKGISVHRLVQEVMRGKVDIEDYPKTLFDSVFLVYWKSYGDTDWYSSEELLHLKSVFKFAWKCEMREVKYFGDSLFFLLELDRIDCAEKLTKIKHPHIIEFSSDFGVGKKEFFEKVLLWSFFYRYTRTNKEEIAKGEFNVNWKFFNAGGSYSFYCFHIETLEGCLQISEKYFGESSEINFALENLRIRNLCFRKEFDKALELCQVIFPFDNDDGKANFLYETISIILSTFDDELESVTPSRLASLDKIMNHFGNIYPNDSAEWWKVEASWCDLKGDYKKALELCTKLVEKGKKDDANYKYIIYKYKIIELRIKLTDFDSTTVEEFVREFGGVEFDYLTLRGVEQILEIYELNLGEVHELTINLKLVMAGGLSNTDTAEEREKCIELCENVLRSEFDQKYEKAFEYLCNARDIEEDDDERRKILQNLFETKRRELGENHRNTNVVLELLNGVPG